MGATKRPRQTRGSDKDDEAEGADSPKVKQEEMSDAGKQHVVLKCRAEQIDSTESKRKAAVAAPQKEAVVAKATSLAKESKPRDNQSESDSSSESYASSGAKFPRGRSPMTVSDRYSPAHPWSDDGQENLSEARARQRARSGSSPNDNMGKKNVKYRRRRARRRSRGAVAATYI